jgi:hypothetical protein
VHSAGENAYHRLAPPHACAPAGAANRTTRHGLSRWPWPGARKTLAAMPSLSLNRRQARDADTSHRDVWTATRFVAAQPPEVLRSLTDPELIGTWAPIDFEVDGLEGRRLRSGSHAWVNGSLGGVAAEFEIEVLHADERGLKLAARGPVTLDVDYRIDSADAGVMVEAKIRLERERGLSGRVLRAATGALLNAGALDRALRRLAGELTEIDELDDIEFAIAA